MNADLINGQVAIERRTLLNMSEWSLVDQNELWRYLTDGWSNEKKDYVVKIETLKPLLNDKRLFELYKVGLRKAIEFSENNNETEITLFDLENIIQPRQITIKYYNDKFKRELPR